MTATADIEIRVTSKTDLSRLSKELGQVDKQLRSMGDTTLDVKADTSKARRELDSIPPPTIDARITADPQKAGQAVSDAFDGADLGGIAGRVGGDIGGGLADAVGSRLGGALAVGGPIAAVFGVAAEVWGDDAAEGFSTGFTRKNDRILDSVRYGLDDAALSEVGEAAGAAWATGFDAGLRDLQTTAATLENTLSAVDPALDLTASTKSAQALAEVYGVELPQSADLARRMVANGLAPDTVRAYQIMGDAAQKYQLDADEMFDVMKEFSPVFGKLGVDGAQAMHIIGETVRTGLLPNVDRAAELFEEFNIEMTDTAGRARPAIQALGLDFDGLQDKIASGRGAEALAEVSTALLNVGDEARRNELAVTIFGTSIESAADPEAALRLLATADAVGEVGTAMDDAISAVEATDTGFDKLGRTISTTAGFLGGALSNQIDTVYAQFGQLAGITETLGQTLGVIEESGSKASRGVDKASVAATDGAAGFASLEDKTRLAHEALQAWADNSGEAALRGLYEAVDGLSDALTEETAASYDATEGWNMANAAGREGSEVMGQFRSDIAALTDAYLNGEVSASEYRTATNDAAAAMREAGRKAGLTEAEVSSLIQEYLRVPAGVSTSAVLHDLASPRLLAHERELNRVNGKSATTTTNHKIITTYQKVYNPSKYPNGASGGIKSAATGGLTDGLVLVGEEGPELVRLGIGAQVNSTADTERMSMMASGGHRRRNASDLFGGGGGMSVTVNVAGSVLSNRDLVEIINDEFERGGFGGRGLGGAR